MKSTGEVMGIDYDFGRAYYKASISADNELPVEGNVFISVSNEQKDIVIDIARKLKALGLTLYGTSGTVEYLTRQGSKQTCQEGTGGLTQRHRPPPAGRNPPDCEYSCR